MWNRSSRYGNYQQEQKLVQRPLAVKQIKRSYSNDVYTDKKRIGTETPCRGTLVKQIKRSYNNDLYTEYEYEIHKVRQYLHISFLEA